MDRTSPLVKTFQVQQVKLEKFRNEGEDPTFDLTFTHLTLQQVEELRIAIGEAAHPCLKSVYATLKKTCG